MQIWAPAFMTNLFEIGGLTLRLPPAAVPAVQELAGEVGLASLIKVDQNGLIVEFAPAAGMKWQHIFFIQNLMIGQRTQLMDEFLQKQGVIK